MEAARKIVVSALVSLDGVMEGPGSADDFARAGWTMPYFTEDVGNTFAATMTSSDALLLGRKTYQGFAAAFATQTGGFADLMNNMPKYVVSATLRNADWHNSTLIRANAIEAISALKQQPGKDLFISGSLTLVQALQQHDLIDEYRLLLHPVLVGSGKRLFATDTPAALRLVDARQFGRGVMFLTYQVDH